MTMSACAHVPVGLDRVLALLAPALAQPGAVFVDATAGMGGHAAAVAKACPEARIIAMDRDLTAVAAAGEALAQFGARATVVHANYSHLAQVCEDAGVQRIDAVLFDLGVSSPQLDQDERGFAYSRDVFLDMRMDRTQTLTAAQVLAEYSQADLARVLRSYGQERFAGRIAAAVVRARQTAPVQTSAQLVELIRAAIPAPARRQGGHPAKRTFQALRVEVNSEIDALLAALPQAYGLLRVGGRMVVESYQSLEDAAVKGFFGQLARSRAPAGLPVEPESAKPRLRLLTRGAEQATDEEQQANPRSAPLRLRAAEKTREEA